MQNETASTQKEGGGLRINKGLICAIACLLFSVLYLVAARTYPNLSTDYMLVSAAFFPTVVAIVMIVCSVVMLIKAIVKPEVRAPLSKKEKTAYTRGLLAILDCIVYALLFEPLGYIVSSTLALFVLMIIFGNRKWWLMALVSIVLSVLLYLLFYYVMQTNLPAGVLGYVAELF